MPLNCENKVDMKCMHKLKKKSYESETAVKSICDSNAMLNASYILIFPMFNGFFICVCVQYAHPNRN